ncbi:MAG: FAD-dependent oxidoreductase, partial [Sphaerochaetaceae bacterium]|nr:FAD-dependent oxidoreductase [Sphaerochaetaceae bacterium]
EIMPHPGGLARNIHQCLHDFDIPLYLSTGISNVYGRHRVEGIRIAPVDADGTLDDTRGRDIACDTILLSVGLIPENELSRKAHVMLDPRTQGAMVDARCMTSIPGVFACGNVLHVHDVADFVSEEGALAGKSAALWSQKPMIPKVSVPVSCGQDIRYTVPQKINEPGDIVISLRVLKPRPSCRIIVKQGNRVLAKKSFIRLQSSEMVRIPVTIENIEPVEVVCETT